MQRSDKWKGLKYLASIIILIILFAMAYERAALWKDVKGLWEDVVKKSPKKARVHHNLGVVYSIRGLFSPGVQEFYKALEINPDYWLSHFNIGKTYWKAGFTDVAVKEFLETIRLNPYSYQAHMHLGGAYEELGQYQKALFEYGLALTLKSDDPEIKERFEAVLKKLQSE